MNQDNQQPQPPVNPAPEPIVVVAPDQNAAQESKKRFSKLPTFPKINIEKLVNNRKKIVVILVTILVVLLLLSALPSLLKLVKSTPSASPTPTVESTPAPTEVANPSIYANDPEVLKIEENINTFGQKLNNAQFREDNLRVPNLDWEVSFE